ncbi:hypothetical protein GS429_16795 [Natronorubrum sp. JWXQ-INN-674]|uniref:Uncharacterized protein n=1 Tax=Natronorubrum halalkaliphilum TaxID=2691917 RepID=A0A6B0VRI0_9EURY|nr:hypothetical protein [Natronorubrum halalkaliphilum]MXV63687.1 hypothetical protein [Natronorubrum halalkaliphilum]
MLETVYGLVSLVFVLGGVLVAVEYRSYTDEQRARAPLLSRAYLGCAVALCLGGAGGLAWLVSGGNVWTMSAIVTLIGALPCFVQFLLHRKLDVQRSPLADRLGDAVARTVNAPDHER